MKNEQGFTLIELLVVIAILAGMVAILFPNFMDVRERARDNQRKADLKNYQKALEFYKDNQNPPKYPPDASFPLPCVNWTVSGFQYMAKTPGEPIGNCTTNIKKYYYHSYEPADPLRYDMYACLENKLDQEGGAGPAVAPFFDTQAGYTCTSGIYYKVSEP